MFLTAEPLWLSGIVVIGLITLAGMLGPVLIRRNVGLERLRTNNEVAGFKFAAIGVLYAVLLAFAVILVWERFNAGENVVVAEAGAAATIYRLAGGVGGEEEAALRDEITAYLQAAITQDWPAMERGRASPAVTQAVNRIYATVLAFHPADRRASVVFAEILHQLDMLTQARRARLVIASAGIPAILWLALFVGAAVTIGFTFFFGTGNLRTQALMTGMLALLIASQLWVIVAIDRPFTGTVRVQPHALAAVLEDATHTGTP
jgi:hypothetical protein